MKISVITPSFNQAQFLETAIQSVLSQSYPDKEYIIIDGGSTDGSREIIKKYENHLSYWVSEKDNGQAHAINKGFRRASGDAVGWLNSDDYLEQGCFSRIAEVFQKHPDVGVVYTDVNLVDGENNFLGTYSVPDVSVHKLLNGNPNVVQPGSFYRRSFLDKAGLLDESLQYVMDYELWLRLGKVSRFHHICSTLADFRYHPASKTGSQRCAISQEVLKVRSRYGIKKISWQNRFVLYRILRDIWR